MSDDIPIVGVDPGIDMCGVAIFDEKRFKKAFLARSDASKSNDILYRAQRMALAVVDPVRCCVHRARFIVEWPQVFMPGKSRGDNNDLLVLAAVAGAIAAMAPPYLHEFEIRSASPDGWRYGQVKKGIAFSRATERMDEDERRRLGDQLAEIPKSYQEHVQDAVGIAMFGLGRTKPRLVI